MGIQPNKRRDIVQLILREEEESTNLNMDYLAWCADAFPDHTRLILEGWDAFSSALSVTGWITTLPLDTQKLIREAAYTTPWCLRDAVEFAPMFISHECHDDGDPQLLTLVNPAFPNGRPPLTQDKWREHLALRHTPSIPTVDPGTCHVTARLILKRPVFDSNGVCLTTSAASLDALRTAIEWNSEALFPGQPSPIQQALVGLI